MHSKDNQDIMLQTLPLVLFILMTEVTVGSVAVLVFLDWRNEVKRGFLISYALIYLGLASLTYLFQQSFATAALLNTYTQIDKAWTGYQSLPLLLFFLLLIPYSLSLLMDKNAGVDGKVERAKAEAQAAEGVEHTQPPHSSVIRSFRLASGAATVIAGLVTLLVMAMIFRPLAAANFAGVFTVAAFFAAAFALGGVMTAMWLGHWYLVTPALSEKPLQFATSVVLIAVFVQVIFSFLIGPMTSYVNKPTSSATAVTTTAPTGNTSAKSQVKPEGAPVVTPLSPEQINWVRILVSFVLPLMLGGLAWKLIRDRSFQSATGMLYLVVVCSLAGEAMARGLFLMGL